MDKRIEPRHEENKSKLALETGRVEDMEDISRHEQEGVQYRAVRHRRGTQHCPKGWSDRSREGIKGSEQQIDYDPHLGRLKGSDSTTPANSTRLRPVVGMTHYGAS